MERPSYSFQPPDLSYLNEVSGGSKEMIIEIFRIFEKEAAADLIKLSHHLDRGEALEAGQTAHKIKGSLLTLGATELKNLFLELEKLGKEQGDIRQMQTIFVDAERGIYALIDWSKKKFINSVHR